jgi:Leucine-rich repeat (LRR) protein
LLGWWVILAKRQAAAVALLESKGSFASFSYTTGVSDKASQSKPQAQWVPEWLREQLGPHKLATIRAVRLGSPNEPQRQRLVDSDLSVLKQLPQLRELNIMLTNVTDEGLKQIANCQDLRVLMFWNNPKITDASMQTISQLERLHSLEAGGPLCGDAGLAYISEMEELRELKLADYRDTPGITDAGMQHIGKLENLELLSLQNASITDEGLRHLEKLKSLKTLDLTRTNVSAAGVARLQSSLPKCAISIK